MPSAQDVRMSAGGGKQVRAWGDVEIVPGRTKRTQLDKNATNNLSAGNVLKNINGKKGEMRPLSPRNWLDTLTRGELDTRKI